MSNTLVPARLASGIAALANVADVTVSAATLDPKRGHWEIPFSVAIASPSAYVAAVTQWVARVDPAYPSGVISVYPAVVGGMSATFQHQNPNVDPLGKRTQGKLCLDSPYGRRLLAVYGNEPLEDADARLAWHLRRAVAWVNAASKDTLMDPGDPFELPRVVSTGIRFVHDESEATFSAWEGHEGKYGRVKFRALSGIDRTLVATSFVTEQREPVRNTRRFTVGKVIAVGLWWLWPRFVVVPPWQPVTTWRELREVGRAQGIQVDSVLKAAAALSRGKGPLVLMVGYRMPRTWAGALSEVHWEVVKLPELSDAPPRGQRPSPKAWWRRDRQEIFHDEKPIPYATVENWHPDRLQARGRLPALLTKQKIAVIGCGALGSRVAELLVRAGASWLQLIDSEAFVAGNSVRHELNFESLAKPKASELARVLRLASPVVRIDPHDIALPTDTKRLHELLADADIVLDCTATDEVPLLLAGTVWSIPKWFVSASFGFRAQRLFVFRCFQQSFPASRFQSDLKPWMDIERKRWEGEGEISEGTGCYSPLLPARVDDIAAGAVAVVKFVEDSVARPAVPDELVVMDSRPPYVGLRRVFLDD